jgi:sRNA-binding protein
LAGTFEGRRAEKIERYTETSRGSSERERERERERKHIEADAGADTKTTTTKMRKRKNKRKKTNTIKPHTWPRGPRRRGFSNPHPRPEPQLEHPRTSRKNVSNAVMIRAARHEWRRLP